VDGRTTRYFALLTPTNIRVLKPLSAGATNKEIAHHLGIAESTVKEYVSDMLREGKFGNRVQLARWATLHSSQVFKPGVMVELDLHLDEEPLAA
jgi:DNA-binding NarL/FixJ family response regulator